MKTSKNEDELVRRLSVGVRNGRIFNDAVRAHWSADSARFSYRRLSPKGVEYILVEPKGAIAGPLFDDATLKSRLAEAAGGGRVELEDLEQLALAPDGAGFSFIFRGRRWRASLEDLSLTDRGPAAGAGETPSPDGSARAITADHNIWILEANGERRQLTKDGDRRRPYDFIGFTSMLASRQNVLPPPVVWSSDSRRLAVIRADLRAVSDMHLLQHAPPGEVRPRLHTFPYPTPDSESGAKLEIFFLDRFGGAVRAKLGDLTTFGFNPLVSAQGWWEADGRHFLLIDAARHAHEVRIWRVDADTGEAELLVLEAGVAVGRPNLGGPPAVHRLSDGRTLFASHRSGWNHLYLVAPGAPESRQAVTSGDWRVLDLIRVDEAAQRILFTAGGREPGVNPYYPQLYSIGFDGVNLKRLTPENFSHDLTLPLGGAAQFETARFGYGVGADGVSPNGAWFVDCFGAVDAPAQSVLRNCEGELVMPLEAADGSQSWPSEMPLPESFKVSGLDSSTELWGVLYKPSGFDPARRYPVVEVVYGGPQIVASPKTFRQAGVIAATAEQLAAIGYVVVIIDGPGTDQRSREFWLRSYGRIESCGGLDDHVAAIRSLAAERAWMDLSGGVAITGHSGGGYATVRAMATYPEFYRVGVSICGNHDQVGYVAQWGDYFHGRFDPGLYKDQANAAIAARITGKLLLIHGDMDDNVHVALSLQVVDALIKADRDFDLLIVPNAGHEVAIHPYALRRTYDFLRRHLPPNPGSA